MLASIAADEPALAHRAHMEPTIVGVATFYWKLIKQLVIFNAARLETGCYDIYKPQNMKI